MLPTPSTSHVSFDTIYEPAEDSFLLLDTLSSQSESEWLTQRFRGARTPLALEIGTGSGVVIAFLAANSQPILGRSILAIGVDVNTNACLATTVTANRAISEQESRSVFLGSACVDLGATVRPNSIDILIFNPPYVPSEELPSLPHLKEIEDSYRHDSHLLSLSYAGGKDGMETTDRLLEQFPGLLSDRGVAYILLCAQNKPLNVKQRIRAWKDSNWQVDTVKTSGKVAGWEKLQILRIWKDCF